MSLLISIVDTNPY